MICFNQRQRQDIHLEGTRDFEHLNIPSQYIKIRLSDCDPSRFSDDQIKKGLKCKSKEEIIKWKYNKNSKTVALTAQVNFLKEADKLVQ